MLEIRGIQEKFENLSSRVDHLENLSLTNNNNNGESQVVRTEEPSDVGNRQDQQVYTFLVEYFLRVYQIFYKLKKILCTKQFISNYGNIKFHINSKILITFLISLYMLIF